MVPTRVCGVCSLRCGARAQRSCDRQGLAVAPTASTAATAAADQAGGKDKTGGSTDINGGWSGAWGEWCQHFLSSGCTKHTNVRADVRHRCCLNAQRCAPMSVIGVVCVRESAKDTQKPNTETSRGVVRRWSCVVCPVCARMDGWMEARRPPGTPFQRCKARLPPLQPLCLILCMRRL